MGLAAHQEEIIAQLYREIYRKLVVYADTPQGQRRRSCQQCADYRTHLLEYRSAPAHNLFELQMRANTASRFCFPASHPAPSYSPDSHWSPLERKKGRNLWFLKSPGLADLMFCCLFNSPAYLSLTTSNNSQINSEILLNGGSSPVSRSKTEFVINGKVKSFPSWKSPESLEDRSLWKYNALSLKNHNLIAVPSGSPENRYGVEPLTDSSCPYFSRVKSRISYVDRGHPKDCVNLRCGVELTNIFAATPTIN